MATDVLHHRRRHEHIQDRIQISDEATSAKVQNHVGQPGASGVQCSGQVSFSRRLMQEFPLKTVYHFCCYFLLFFLLVVVVSGGVVAVVVIAAVVFNAAVVVSFLLVLLLLLVSLILLFFFLFLFVIIVIIVIYCHCCLWTIYKFFPAVSTFQTDAHKSLLIIVLGQTVNAKRRANEGKLAVLTALRTCFWSLSGSKASWGQTLNPLGLWGCYRPGMCDRRIITDVKWSAGLLQTWHV